MGILSKVLGTLSGGMAEKLSEQLLFDKTIGIRGIKDGVGCSTFVFNLVCGLIDATHYNVCVVDTNLLYPAQEFLLGADSTEENGDLMDYSGENLSQIAYKTKYTNVYCVSFRNRYLADMLSSKECQPTVDKLFEDLKKFFDIVIVDLSHEPTWASTVAALKCNRIYTILSPDLPCLSVLQKSMNSLASVGVPLFKMRKVIINKNIADVNTGIYKALNNLDLEIFADVPFSVDIARYGITGNRIWGAFANNKAVTIFNQTIDRMLDDICQSNDTNKGMIRSEDIPMEELEKESASENIGMFDDVKKADPGLDSYFGMSDMTQHVNQSQPVKESEEPVFEEPSFEEPAKQEAGGTATADKTEQKKKFGDGLKMSPLKRKKAEPAPPPPPVEETPIEEPLFEDDDEIDLFGD